MDSHQDVGQLQDEPLYALALAEVNAGNPRPGLWAMALAEALGDEQKARALYIKLRVESERQTQVVEPALRGVRGWLLLLVILLVFVWPIFALSGIGSDLGAARRLGGQFEGLKAALQINAFVAFLFAIYSVYVGWALWTLKSGAVSMTKKYLIAILVAQIVMFILFLIILPEQEFSAVSFGAIVGILGSAFWVAIWYLYLQRSKRVRATYTSEAIRVDGA